MGKTYYKKKRIPSAAWGYFKKSQIEENVVICSTCRKKVRVAGACTSSMFKHLAYKHPELYLKAKAQMEENKKLMNEMSAENPGPTNVKIKQSVMKRGVRKNNRAKSAAEQMEVLPFITKDEFLPGESPEAFSVNFSGASSSKKHFQVTVGNHATVNSYGVSKKTFESCAVSHAVLRMLTVDLVPVSFIKGKGFQDLLKLIDIRYELPDKKTLMDTLLTEVMEATKKKLKQEVSLTTHVCLSIDSWLYCESQNCITVTVHYLDKNWNLADAVLDSFDCSNSNTVTDIAARLKCMAEEWGITKKVCAFITNNKDDNVITAIMSVGWEHLSCFGHLLNEVVLTAMNSVKEFVRIQKKVSEIVDYFETCNHIGEALNAIQTEHSMPNHKLKQQVPTRWHSIYNMLERLLEQYEPVNTVLCTSGKDTMCIFDDEIESIKHFLEVLLPFESATKELCSESYTPISKVIPIANLLQQVTAAVKALESDPHAQLKNALLQQMELHFTNLEFIRSMAMATLLDPRFKKHGFNEISSLETVQQHVLKEASASVSASETVSNSKPSQSNSDLKIIAFWDMFDRKVSEAGDNTTATSEADNEIRRYLKEANTDRSSNPGLWWRLNEIQYPNLKSLAQKYLCIPATAVLSERIFTKQSELDALKRNLIEPKHLFQTVFLNRNLR